MFKTSSSKNEVNSVHLRSKSPKSNFLILINHKPTIINDEITYEPKTTQNNKIITSKYTLLNFLPKNLFVQFKRIGNFYFLMTTIIQLCIDSPVSPATSLVPLSFVVCITAIKQAYEDWLRHKSDKLINSRLLPLVSQDQKLIKIKSQNIRLGDIIQVNDEEEIPCDLILLSSSHSEGVCSITTANLDGETNLKKKFSISLTRNCKTVSDLSKLSGYIECEEPNSDLYEFSGILSINDCKENLKADNLLLRGSRLINTNYIFGIAVYTGKLTKMSLNSKFISIKFSSLEQSINNYLGIFLILLLAFCLLCLYLRYQIILNSEYILKEHWYLKNVFFPYTKLDSQSLTYNFLNFFVLFNYLIPISLYVSLEMTRFFGSKLMVLNKSFEKETEDDVLICNCSDINEELGQVKYLFSDKTGTLTQNLMKFVACSINGKKYIIKNKELYKIIDGNETKIEKFDQEMNFFFVCLALCNTVSVKTNKNNFNQNNYEYIADSSDEKALVDVAAELNIKLLSSNENEYKILVNEKVNVYKKIKIIEFDSIRKRMSVIVKDPDNKIILICKGADSEVISLVENCKTKEICNDIDDYAMQGLRTLTIAYRYLKEEELSYFFELNQKALTDFKNKKQKLELANSFVEDKLVLLGATGIEDKLQEDVEETLLALRKAGIYIWLLTGDKLETAISVAFSCKLIEPEFHLMFLSKQKDSTTCKETLIKFWLGIKNSISYDKEKKNSIETNYERTYKNMIETLELADNIVEKLKIFLNKTNAEGMNSKKAKLDFLEKLEEKVSNLLKLEKTLQEFQNYSKDKKKSFVKKLGLKKINIQANRIIDELKCIEAYLETNDLTKMSKNTFRYKSSSSLNENDFFSKKNNDIDFETFNTDKEIKTSKSVSKLLKEKFVLILDGRSLHIAMKYHFPLLELICSHCVVVISCRMSPIQKARMVKMIKNSPSKPVTAAIGDGANDVSMIQEANVGFGLIGKEGIQAVRNSDFAFSKFKFVKTVLLIHGHYFYVRMTQLVHFFFFKSLLFIIPQFIYSFYNMFSGQTIYHGMLLMTYNLLFTATPIFFHSLQDEHIPKMFLKEFPKLYKTISENSLMSLSVIIKWMTFSTIQGIFIFYSVKFLWPGTISMLDDGKEIGIFSFGLIIYHIIVLVVNIKILIMTRNWEKNFIISFVTSILILPIFCIIYSSFKWNFLDDGMFGQYNQLFKSFSFWITVFSITFFSILPDIFYSVLETSIRLKFFKKLILKKN